MSRDTRSAAAIGLGRRYQNFFKPVLKNFIFNFLSLIFSFNTYSFQKFSNLPKRVWFCDNKNSINIGGDITILLVIITILMMLEFIIVVIIIILMIMIISIVIMVQY